jgi:hypothetical protein
MWKTSEEFDFTVWSLTGRDMPSIDGFLKNGEGSGVWDYISPSGDAVGQGNRQHLLEMRDDAFEAFKADNMPLMEATIEALFLNAENIGYRWSVHKKAQLGARFTNGRKSGTGSPIRKKIAGLLKKNPDMKNKELWEKITENPPRGWAYYDTRQGKYFEGPKLEQMHQRRFFNVCSEERGRFQK